MCSVSEPLVRVLRLVDGDKPTLDRAKEAIRNYYVGKGTPGHNKHMLLWDLIDSQWTGMLHRPIHEEGLFLNPAFAYKCNFDFDSEVLEGLLTCIQRMIPDYETHNVINHGMVLEYLALVMLFVTGPISCQVSY